MKTRMIRIATATSLAAVLAAGALGLTAANAKAPDPSAQVSKFDKGYLSPGVVDAGDYIVWR